MIPPDSSLYGLPMIHTDTVDRGRAFVMRDPAAVVVGTGLLRGVPYRAPGMDRGYVLERHHGGEWLMLDAPTGRLVWMPPHHCVAAR
jgi:hypothetical protein